MSSSKVMPTLASSGGVVSAGILMVSAGWWIGIIFGLILLVCLTLLYFAAASQPSGNKQSDPYTARLAKLLDDMVDGQPVDPADLPEELAEPLRRLSARLEVLNDELDDLSPRDRLTSLAKEDVFNNVLWREFNRSQRYGEPMSVALLEIRDFDQIRREGEERADEVLKSVASVVLRMVRETDLAARYGDERLAVIMPGTAYEGAREFAQRFHRELEESAPGAPSAGLSVAIGVASLPEEGTKTAPELVKKAAAALKAAGNGGPEGSTNE